MPEIAASLAAGRLYSRVRACQALRRQSRSTKFAVATAPSRSKFTVGRRCAAFWQQADSPGQTSTTNQGRFPLAQDDTSGHQRARRMAMLASRRHPLLRQGIDYRQCREKIVSALAPSARACRRAFRRTSRCRQSMLYTNVDKKPAAVTLALLSSKPALQWTEYSVASL